MKTEDSFLLLLVFSLSVVTRFWLIHHPDCVVFDEVHFGNFTNWYTKSEYFYDIHPPLGKLVMFLFANLSEYNGNIDFEGWYAKKYLDEQYIILRITPAFFSSLCAPMIYMSMKFLGFSSMAAFVSSFCMIFDTSLLTEHRFILSDGMLHFFTCLFFVVYSYKRSLSPKDRRFSFWMNCSGYALGAACSCKNTAWGLIGYVAITEILDIIVAVRTFNIHVLDRIVYNGLVLFMPMVIVYLCSFCIHFMLLPFCGQGSPYLPSEMQKQLVNKTRATSQLWGKRIQTPNMYVRILTLAVNMHYGNMGITQFHPYQSRPQGWPLLTDTYVAFWVSGMNEVNCMGNVFVYYIVVLSLITNFFGIWKKNWYQGLNFVFGWCSCYLPFFLIPRSMYLYHYLIPLMIGCMSIGSSIDIWLKNRMKGFISFLICILALVGFYFWSPYAYGTPHLDRSIVIWNDNWIYGDKHHRKLQIESRKK